MVVCWGPASPGRTEGGILSAALDLAEAHEAKVLVCPPHAGSQGLIDMGVHPLLDAGYKRADNAGRGTRAILEAAANGEIDALLVVGADPIADFPDGDLARRAMERCPFSAVMELFATQTAVRANVVLPSAAAPERDGTFTNLERRLQKLEASIAPAGSAREPWRALAGLAQALGQDLGWHTVADVWTDIRKEVFFMLVVELLSIDYISSASSVVYYCELLFL